MSNVWFTSDLHLGHGNIIKYSDRPFLTGADEAAKQAFGGVWKKPDFYSAAIDEWVTGESCRWHITPEAVRMMDDYILNEINRVVKPDDTLVCNGDWLFGPDKVRRFLEYRNRIACNHIITIWGNHDDVIRHDPQVKACFQWYGDFLERHFDGTRFTLCHYAMRVWNKSHHGAYHLYGHSHGTIPDDISSLSFDCGVDTKLFGHKPFTPYSLEEVHEIMTKHKAFSPVDHHNRGTNP